MRLKKIKLSVPGFFVNRLQYPRVRECQTPVVPLSLQESTIDIYKNIFFVTFRELFRAHNITKLVCFHSLFVLCFIIDFINKSLLKTT